MDTPIGRVYVDDPDDWDLPDKQFQWESREHPRFRLDESTGGLTMRAGTPRGLYELRFRVRDRHHGQEGVAARVRVKVRDLSYSAVTNSGSLRLSGVSAVDLVVSLLLLLSFIVVTARSEKQHTYERKYKSNIYCLRAIDRRKRNHLK